MSRFLMATLPLTGHFSPGLPIARALVRRGHEVWWYTGRKFQAKVEAIGARFVPMSSGFDYDESRLDEAFPGRDKLTGLARLKFDLKHAFIDAAPSNLADLEAVLRQFPADAMIHDTAFMAVPMLSERHGLPYATFGMTVLTFPSRDTAPFGLGLSPRASPLGRLRNRALNWSVSRILFRDVVVHHESMRSKLGFTARARRGFFEDSAGPYLYLQSSVASFEYPRSDLPPQVHFCGPFLPEPAHEFTPLPWWNDLTSGKTVVHVSQGTSANDPRELIVPALRGLAREDVLVVATTGGGPLTALGGDVVPANARVESFVPYYHLLPHVQVMVTNGGYGGVQAALAHGIPLVVAGASEDKPEIANRVAWSGAGLNLRTGTPKPEQVRAAVRAVLDDPRFREQAQKLRAEILRHDASARASQLLEQLATTKRPVLRSGPDGAPPPARSSDTTSSELSTAE